MLMPPGGWAWVIPETGWYAEGGDFAQLVRRVDEHYRSNNLACGDTEAVVERGLCERLLASGAHEFVDQTSRVINTPVVSTECLKTLTIAYLTCRKDCKIEWFYASLARQLPKNLSVHIIVVDSWADAPGRREDLWEKYHQPEFCDGGAYWTHRAPKPSVWSGPHRLTKVDYFSAANSRNTALCLAQTDWIAYVDDLSVLVPGWLDAVMQAMRENYIVLGAYRKVRNLDVRDGQIASYDAFPAGEDNRLKHATGTQTSCGGNWLFGCSFAAPVEALLSVGGSPEMCDSTGLGSEDYCLGIALANAGYAFRYDQRMMTLESEEHHHNPNEIQFKRMDKGVSPNDKSHAMLHTAQRSRYYDNYYPGGMRALRERVLAGDPFPVINDPTTDWYDGQPLSEL